MANTLPPLITSEGLVLNNQMPGEGALGNYTPKGTASSEGISLLMRGMLRAAIATNDPKKKAYAQFLFDAACKYFFKGQRPPATPDVWSHSWICNGGAAFSVRGPLAPSGDLALSGYIFGRDSRSNVVFNVGVGQLNPPPDIVYQVVSFDTEFVWPNVFSDLVKGRQYKVDYYIDSKGNKVFGTQKGGSFGQPAIPAGEHNDGAPGKIVLVDPISGPLGVNFNVTVPDVNVSYGELYEAWPMWRKLAAEEVSTAADAIHWFLDAFDLGRKLDPTNRDWINAFDRMQEVWEMTCDQQSNNTRIFQAGVDGPYNNFPLTYSYGYGRDNIDRPDTNWNDVPPTDRYAVERTGDGFVTFTMPKADAEIGSGKGIRYGIAFENKPLFLEYTANSKLVLNSYSSSQQTLDVVIADAAGKQYTATALLSTAMDNQVEMGMSQFLQFQQEPGDSSGNQTGDWEGDDHFVMPDYPAVTFPGRRMALVGDSITFYNCAYIPPVSWSGLYENYGYGYGGCWVNAEQILRGRTIIEHGIGPNLTGKHTGTGFAVAGTKAQNWWLAQDYPASPNVSEVGPMYAALNNLTKYDLCYIMGGTNDLSGNAKALHVLNRLKRAATDVAKNGKWVYLGVIPPRTRAYLKGYTYIEQTQILERVKEVNQGLRDWITNDRPPNIWLVDWYDDLLGPNGIDPAGLVSDPSNPNGPDTLGNYRADAPGLVFFHDGLHPAPPAGRIMGEKLAEVMIASGIPARESNNTLGPLTLGPNLLVNPTFIFTPFDTTINMNNYNQSDIGWAYGLGEHKKVGTLHDGFTYGKVPNNWRFAKAIYDKPVPIGLETGGVYTNFLRYMYEGMAEEFPAVTPYLADSTWPEGSIKLSIAPVNGTISLIIDVDMPVTGNKNESFVLMTDVPTRQHGPWDNYGYAGPDANNGENAMIVPNTQYFAGDMLITESEVTFEGLNETMHSCQMVLNINQMNSRSPLGSKRSSFGNHPFMYPPSDMDFIRFHTKNRTIQLRGPAVVVPTLEAGENMNFATLKFEIGFDASKIGPKGRIIIKNPSVKKVIGGTPL